MFRDHPDILATCERLAKEEQPSRYVLGTLVDITRESLGDIELKEQMQRRFEEVRHYGLSGAHCCSQLCTQLSELDPIRRKYWEYQLSHVKCRPPNAFVEV